MKSPKDMRIIQIDITNACIHQCSNCTRFCGHHKKPFFMDFDTFKKAVDSLDGYIGTVGVMGGEPTLHPEFEKIANYIGSKFPQLKGKDRQMLHPQAAFMKAIQDLEFSNTCWYDSGLGKRQTVIGPGLLSAMGKHYQKHYEVIQDTFKYQALNDHYNPMYHQPILITRKELGIADEEWSNLRDNCWVQNEWSATITPKGAFFCEVAGALDMLFDGPGGWEIEAGWWMRTPEEFGEQLQWCEFCGLACHTFMRDAREEVDDVSPVLYQKLKNQESPRLKKGQVNLLKIENGVISKESKAAGKRFEGSMPYTESYEARFNSMKSALYPQGFDVIYHLEQNAAVNDIQKALDSMKKQFEKIFIICENTESFNICQGILEKESYVVFNMDTKKYGEILQEILEINEHKNYLAVFRGEVYPKTSFVENMKKYIFNPGTLIYTETGEKTIVLQQWMDYGFRAENCKLLIMNGGASSLNDFDKEDINSLEDLVIHWKQEKIIHFDERLFYYPPETRIYANKRYAIYGNGIKSQQVYENIKREKGEFICIVDSDKFKQGDMFNGHIVHSPEYLREQKPNIDYVLIGSLYYYAEIRNEILKLGFKTNQIAFV